MKTCPKCGAAYGDEIGFCLQDGTALAPTAEMPAVDDREAPSGTDASSRTIPAFQSDRTAGEYVARQRNTGSGGSGEYIPRERDIGSGRSGVFKIIIVALVLLLGLTALLVAAAGGLWYYWNSQRENAAANSNRASNASRETTPDVFSPEYGNTANLSPSLSPALTPTPRKPTPSPSVSRQPPFGEPGNYPADPDDPVEPRTTRSPNIPKTIAGGVLNGKATSLPKPPYPPAARAVRAGGAVNVQVLVDENGQVVSANAVSGHPLLRAAAVQAARGARFSPTMLSGQPVKVTGVIVYNFVP